MPTVSHFGVPVVLLSKIHNVSIDMVDEVTVTHESLVTKHPSETGVNYTDHIVRLPRIITLSGRFSDNPLAHGLAALNPFSGIIGGLTSLMSGGLGGLSQVAWVALENLESRKIRMDVFIQQGKYPNMVFRFLRGPRGKGDGYSQRFEAELHEIITTNIADLTALPSVNIDQGVLPTTGYP